MSNLPSDVEEDNVDFGGVSEAFPGLVREENGQFTPKALDKSGLLRGLFKSDGVCDSVDDEGYRSSSINVDNVNQLFDGLRVTDSHSEEVSNNSISLKVNKCRNNDFGYVSGGTPVEVSLHQANISPLQISSKDKSQFKSEEDFDSGLSSNYSNEDFVVSQFEPDEDGDTNVHNSIIQENPDIAHHLISLAYDYELLNHQNKLSQTPLHLAVLTNQPKVVRRLMVGGAQVDIRDHKGNTPLHIASQRGFHHIVQLLLTPVFHHEIKVNSYEIPYQKIPQDLEIRNYDGLTCLHLSTLGSHIDCMRLLLENRAKINTPDGKSGRTILHYAAEHGNEVLLKFILQAKDIQINTRTYGGLTAIALAQGRGYLDAVQMLYHYGADTSDLNETQEDSEEEDMDDVMYDDIQIAGEPVFT